MADKKYALVFGASGVSGWSTVNEILNDYPKTGIWAGVTALTNRPLSLELSQWPHDDRLSLVSGIDLLKGTQEEVEKEMKAKITHLDEVTDCFYLAYKANTDIHIETPDNANMFERVVLASDHLCPKLQMIVLQTGAKQYGFHLLGNRPEYIVPPIAETVPRMQPPASDGLFYLPQMDFIEAYSTDKKWGWIDTRPDIIIGFVPNDNFYSLGTALGVYLSLRREVDGPGAECPFPGTAKSWVTKSNDSSAIMIARQTMHILLSPKYRGTKGEAFNVADEKTPRTWETRWPDLCSYFGLKGVKAPQDNPVEVHAYIREHADEWSKLEKKYGLRPGYAHNARAYPGFETFLLSLFDQDRQYDMTKTYNVAGFTEERDTLLAWGGVFDRMRAARVIPSEFW